jgi:hypothetical protein
VTPAGEKILGKRERVLRRVAAQIRGAGDDKTWPAIVERDARAMIQADDLDDARNLLGLHWSVLWVDGNLCAAHAFASRGVGMAPAAIFASQGRNRA